MPRITTEPSDTAGRQEDRSTLKTLNAFAIDLISIPNTEDLFWYVAQNVVGRLNFVDCVIYRANPEQSSLVQVAALGEKNPFGRSILNPMKIPFGQGITGRVAQNRQAIVIDDLRLNEDYIEDTQLACSEICVPIVCDNRIVGVIDSEHPEPGAFGEAELEVLTTIAAMTSAKLELLAEAERSNQRYLDLVSAHAELSQAITNRKSLEEDLHAARKLETIGRLTGRFAHEFNNLLTVISGNLEILNDEISGVPLEGPLQDARTAANRGADLIQSMLAFSQRKRIVPVPTDLNRLIEQVIAQDTPSATHRVNLSLGADIAQVNLDRETFEIALLNLISNARDAMPSGGNVYIQTETVWHTSAEDRSLMTQIEPGEYVRLSVGDEGRGLLPDEVRQIFDPFYTTKPVGSGTGLGLSLTLGFMQQSGGTVAVSSEADEGALFQLYIPALSSA